MKLTEGKKRAFVGLLVAAMGIAVVLLLINTFCCRYGKKEIRQLYGDFIDGVENHLLLDPQIFPFPDLFAAVDVPRRAHRKFPGPAAGDAEVVRLLPGEKFR